MRRGTRSGPRPAVRLAVTSRPRRRRFVPLTPWVSDLHRHGGGPGLEVTVAFQPVVDLDLRVVYAYEALVRGRGGAGAAEVLAQVPVGGRYAFDQVCRIAAIALASRLGLTAGLSVNFLPNALYEADTC